MKQILGKIITKAGTSIFGEWKFHKMMGTEPPSIAGRREAEKELKKAGKRLPKLDKAIIKEWEAYFAQNRKEGLSKQSEDWLKEKNIKSSPNSWHYAEEVLQKLEKDKKKTRV
jgi:hypothetical protein